MSGVESDVLDVVASYQERVCLLSEERKPVTETRPHDADDRGSIGIHV